MITKITPFNQLNLAELYEILALRSAVFVVEQECIFQDIDNLDKLAIHVMIHENNKLIAYARILPFDVKGTMSFGRVITERLHRRKGVGKLLMDAVMDYLHTHHHDQAINITAQCYLEKFYQSYGFETQGSPFEMDKQPHILMVNKP